MRKVILACNSLKEYVEEAERVCGTAIPIVDLDQKYHVEPMSMKQRIISWRMTSTRP